MARSVERSWWDFGKYQQEIGQAFCFLHEEPTSYASTAEHFSLDADVESVIRERSQTVAAVSVVPIDVWASDRWSDGQALERGVFFQRAGPGGLLCDPLVPVEGDVESGC